MGGERARRERRKEREKGRTTGREGKKGKEKGNEKKEGDLLESRCRGIFRRNAHSNSALKCISAAARIAPPRL